MTELERLIGAKREHFLEELKEFLRIPSISTLSERSADVQRAAEWVAAQLRAAGMAHVEIVPTAKHPVVYGEWLGAPERPTVLIYGHYDVQPAELEAGWQSDPFVPEVRDGNLYARGASDDKGQVYANIKAIQLLMETRGALPVNVKVLIEGEEEIGSPNLDGFIAAHKERLRADVVVVSDTAMQSLTQPSIVYGLRGLVYVELEVRGPERDLHSGGFGGVVHNPAQALCEIIAALHHPDGRVAVEGFYDKVRPLTAEERAIIAQTEVSEAEWRRLTGAPQPWGEAGYSLRERVGARPTLEINGLWGGFTGEGSKTVLPSKATAKISCRLVPDQDPYEIEALLRAQIAKLAPPTVRWELRALNHGYPALVPLDSAAMECAVTAYERGFGARPLFLREGGSIPVVATFTQTYGAPVLLVGYGLPDDGAHGPNEKFALECLYRGIHTSAILLEELGKRTPEALRRS
ncbi:MAG: dipeptidase [Anaerolineae bacterium]|nr:dipeptidase [Anaerolineae bacterium]